MMTSISPETKSRLIEAAQEAALTAYVPYSNFPVGAALLLSDGSIVKGSNIENISYPASICAERTAVVKAVSDRRKDFVAIAVTGQTEDVITPCGICRQTLAEFGPDLLVICCNKSGQSREYRLPQLLPEAFASLV